MQNGILKIIEEVINITANFDEAVIVQEKEVNESAILGYLVGMTFRNFRMQKEKFEELIAKSDIDDKFKPHLPSGLSAFQLAVRSIEDTVTEEFIDPSTNEHVFLDVDYMIDIISPSVRQLSRKIFINPKSKNITKELKEKLDIHIDESQKEPEKMALFSYDKAENTIILQPLFKENILNIKEMTEKKYSQALHELNEITGKYTERYLKDAYYRLCNAINAIPFLLAPGSVRFVSIKYKEYIDSFIRLYNLIYGRRGISRKIPLLDKKELKEYIKQDLEVEVNRRFELFLKSAANKIEQIRSMSDIDKKLKIEQNLKDKASEFERGLNNTLLKEYNALLGTSIKARLGELPIPESLRLQQARKFLLGVSDERKS